jgi:hypothetical protein
MSRTSLPPEDEAIISNFHRAEIESKEIDKIYRRKLDKLKDNHHLKRATIAQHFKRILFIQTVMTGRRNVKDLSFLKDAPSVIKFVESRYSKDNSLQAQLLSIESVVKEMDGYTEAYNIYHDYTKRLAAKITFDLLQQNQSDEEKINFDNISSVIYNQGQRPIPLSGVYYGGN